MNYERNPSGNMRSPIENSFPLRGKVRMGVGQGAATFKPIPPYPPLEGEGSIFENIV